MLRYCRTTHVLVWGWEPLKAELLIQGWRLRRAEHKNDLLQGRMLRDGADNSLAVAVPAMVRENKYVHHVPEARVVSDNPAKGHLRGTKVPTEAQGICQGGADREQRDALCPM